MCEGGLGRQVQVSSLLVRDVKEMIQKLRGLPTYEQTLVANGEELRDKDKASNELLMWKRSGPGRARDVFAAGH